jgi:hypothetical protein
MSSGLDIKRIRAECELAKSHIREFARRGARHAERRTRRFARARAVVLAGVGIVLMILSLSGAAS